MIDNSDFVNELKALGNELKKAVDEARKSKEFRDLERELVSSVKSVAAEVKKSVHAAKKSRAAKRIKNRLGRVVKAGKAEGTAKAKKAQAEALKRLSDAARTLRSLRKTRKK